MKSLAIGPIARQTGVKVPTIRYYESIGLLPEPARTAAKRRLYGQEDVRAARLMPSRAFTGTTSAARLPVSMRCGQR